jgi:hypothetical protein
MAEVDLNKESSVWEIKEGAVTPTNDPPSPPPVATAITQPAIDPFTGKPVSPNGAVPQSAADSE